MRLRLVAVGRLKAGPERTLFETYQSRLNSAPAQLGPLAIVEIDERKDQKRIDQASQEALSSLQSGTPIIALDERGKDFSSKDLAQKLGNWRDEGAREVVFLIGAADGLSEDIRARADLCIAFGRQTWPHMLMRVMLAEQLYRAASLLSGHPYHRE